MNQVTESRITHFRSGDDVVIHYEGDPQPWFIGVVESANGDVLTVSSPVGSTGTDRFECVFHQNDECSACADVLNARLREARSEEDKRRAAIPLPLLCGLDRILEQRVGCGHGQSIELPADLPGLPEGVHELLNEFAYPTDCPDGAFAVSMPAWAHLALFDMAPEMWMEGIYMSPPPELQLRAAGACSSATFDADVFAHLDCSWSIALTGVVAAPDLDDEPLLVLQEALTTCGVQYEPPHSWLRWEWMNGKRERLLPNDGRQTCNAHVWMFTGGEPDCSCQGHWVRRREPPLATW